ncbi:hypothetical protein Vretimale_882, partial [Volvox reticuliferus]
PTPPCITQEMPDGISSEEAASLGLPPVKTATKVMRPAGKQQQQQPQSRQKRGREQEEEDGDEEEQQRSRRTRLANAPCGKPRAAFVGGGQRKWTWRLCCPGDSAPQWPSCRGSDDRYIY